MLDDIPELLKVVEAHDHHQGMCQLWVFCAGQILRRFAQIQMKGEKWREEVVLEIFT